MGLRQAGLIYRAEAATTLIVTPLAGEGLRIRKVQVINPSVALQFATFITGTARVGFFRTIGLGGAHLIPPNELARGMNFVDFLADHFEFIGYPVDEGHTFEVRLDAGDADIFIQADSYDSADISADQPNGRGSRDLLYVSYGTNIAAIAASGYNKVDDSRNPVEMIQFPWGVVGAGLVPAGFKAEVSIIGGQAVGRQIGAGDNANTEYLRPKKGAPPGVTLFDRADVGYQFFGTIPAAGNVDYTGVRQNIPSSEAPTAQRNLLKSNITNPVILLGPNDELQLEVSTLIAVAGQLNVGDIDVWCLLHLTPAG